MKIFIAILLWTFVSCRKAPDNLSKISRDINIHQSIIKERVWKDIELEEISLDNQINSKLLNPTHVRENNGYLYFMDTADNLIKKFTFEGVFIDSIGNGYGRGPGEFLTFSDMSFGQNLGWVIDVNKKEISVFDQIGNIESKFFFKPNTYRLAISEENIFLLTLGDSLLIYKYDKEGKVIDSFGKIVDDQISRAMDLAGRIVYIKKTNELLYIPHMASYLIYFDSQGNIKRTIQTLDKISFPESRAKKVESGKYRATAPKSEIEISDWSISGDKLILKGFQRTGENIEDRIDFFDVYSLDGMEYFYSIKVPFASHSFSVTNKNIFFIEIIKQRVRAFNYQF